MFELMEFLFPIAFFLILGLIVVQMVRGIAQWNKNNHSPRLTVEATVAAKRTDVAVHHHAAGANAAGGVTHTTTYYVTFQVESGDRMELPVQGYDYGMLVEGDYGRLTFQGTRYLGFERRARPGADTPADD